MGWLAVVLGLLEGVVSFRTFWPERRTLEPTLLKVVLAKGVAKTTVYLVAAALLVDYLPAIAPYFVLGHPLLGVLMHVVLCRRHGANWLTVRPRERYIRMQTEGFERLLAARRT